MKCVQNLASVLSDIEKMSNKIVKNTLAILTDLADADSDMVEDVTESCSGISPEDILEKLREITIPLSSDAETILAEISSFSENIIQGDDILDDGGDDYPFLLQVWYGDIYEKEELLGLKELYMDLEDQYEKITDSNIVILAIDSFAELNSE